MSLKLENISKKFGEKIILQNFNYEFEKTGIYIIKGKSGIGKTTLIRIIAGLDSDYSGNVIDGGISNVSVCFQEYRLFPQLTAIDNVILASYDKPTKENYSEGFDILSRLGFKTSDMKLFPSELSGGMKQRVSLARSIIRKRPILLLDEATKELDQSLINEVLDIIKELSETRLVLLITHSQSDLKHLPIKGVLELTPSET